MSGPGELWVRLSRLNQRCEIRIATTIDSTERFGWQIWVTPRPPLEGSPITTIGASLTDTLASAVEMADALGW